MFAFVGAWLILPFVGLEPGALYVAFRLLDRRADDYEQLTLAGDRLVVEQQTQGRVKLFECNRPWAQVVVRRQNAGLRLALRYHGRKIESGRCLSDEARSHAARRLQEQLRVKR